MEQNKNHHGMFFLVVWSRGCVNCMSTPESTSDAGYCQADTQHCCASLSAREVCIWWVKWHNCCLGSEIYISSCGSQHWQTECWGCVAGKLPLRKHRTTLGFDACNLLAQVAILSATLFSNMQLQSSCGVLSCHGGVVALKVNVQLFHMHCVSFELNLEDWSESETVKYQKLCGTKLLTPNVCYIMN